MIKKTFNDIADAVRNNPLQKGESLLIIGCSEKEAMFGLEGNMKDLLMRAAHMALENEELRIFLEAAPQVISAMKKSAADRDTPDC